MIKKFFAVIFVLFLGGCAPLSYVRSDIFIDPELVRSIYLMPIAQEVTIDPDLVISREELQKQLQESRALIRKVINEEFTKRGYAVNGSAKDFVALNKNNPQEELIRQAIFEFVKPSSAKATPLLKQTSQETKNNSETVLSQATIDDREEPLIGKTLACSSVFSAGTDTVLFLIPEKRLCLTNFPS